MSVPTITGVQDVEVKEFPPPPAERIRSHRWLSPKAQKAYEEACREGLELYISKVAEEKMRNHALSKVNERKEVMGLMLGGVYRHRGKDYALVRDVVTTDLDATEVSVRFDRDAFEKLFASLEETGFRYIIVGWYHSHPSYSCFMSSTDIQTQRAMFDKSFHSALVIDPINREIEVFRLNNGRVEPRPFAVYWEPYQDPYNNRMVRLRKQVKAPEVPEPEATEEP